MKDTITFESYYPNGNKKLFLTPDYYFGGQRYIAEYNINGLLKSRVFIKDSVLEKWDYVYQGDSFFVSRNGILDLIGVFSLGDPKIVTYMFEGDTLSTHEYINPKSSYYEKFSIINYQDTVEITSGVLKNGILWSYCIEFPPSKNLNYFNYYRSNNGWESKSYEIQEDGDTINVGVAKTEIEFYQ